MKGESEAKWSAFMVCLPERGQHLVALDRTSPKYRASDSSARICSHCVNDACRYQHLKKPSLHPYHILSQPKQAISYLCIRIFDRTTKP